MGGKGNPNPTGGKNGGKSNKALKRQNNKYKRQIKALKRKMKTKDENDEDLNRGSESEEDKDAGDSFGGRQSKKNQKKKPKT